MTMYTILGYRIACIVLDCTFSVLLLYGPVGSNIMSSGDGGSAPNISFLNEYGTEIGWKEGLEASNHLVVYGLHAFFSDGGISLLAFDGNMRIIHSGRRNDMGNGPFFLE